MTKPNEIFIKLSNFDGTISPNVTGYPDRQQIADVLDRQNGIVKGVIVFAGMELPMRGKPKPANGS